MAAALMEIADEGLPPEYILRLKLAEGHDNAVMAVTGVETSVIATQRRNLQITDRWKGQGLKLQKAVGRAFERRWTMWQEELPEPITLDGFDALVMAEMGHAPRPAPRPVIEPSRRKIETAARLLIISGSATDAAIANMTGYTEEQVRNVMRRSGLEFIRRPDGTYTREPGWLTHRECWPRERAERHAAAIIHLPTSPWQRPDAARGRDVIRFKPVRGIASDAPLEPWHRRPVMGWTLQGNGSLWRCTAIRQEYDRTVYVMAQEATGSSEEAQDDMCMPDGIRIKAAIRECQAHGTTPTDDLLAEMCDCSPEQVHHKLLNMRGDIICHKDPLTDVCTYSLYQGVGA